MTSSNPLGPFTYAGTCLNNPGDSFQTEGNNHHTVIEFKGQHYIFYQAEWLNKEYGEMLGYSTTHVYVMSLNGEKLGNTKGTLTGVQQVGDFDPYEKIAFIQVHGKEELKLKVLERLLLFLIEEIGLVFLVLISVKVLHLLLLMEVLKVGLF